MRGAVLAGRSRLRAWAGGFFGGGLLPGLCIGPMLGGGFDASSGDFGGGGDF